MGSGKVIVRAGFTCCFVKVPLSLSRRSRDVDQVMTASLPSHIPANSRVSMPTERPWGMVTGICRVQKRLRSTGLEFSIRHAANSAGVIALPEAHLDLVRPGIAVYGLNPSDEIDLQGVDLRPAMALKARLIQVKRVPAGFSVSYGMTHRTPQPTTIATVPAGYADGLNRALSNRGQMLVHGQRVPIVGRVCMDLTMLDVGGAPDVQVGDPVHVTTAGSCSHYLRSTASTAYHAPSIVECDSGPPGAGP